MKSTKWLLTLPGSIIRAKENIASQKTPLFWLRVSISPSLNKNEQNLKGNGYLDYLKIMNRAGFLNLGTTDTWGQIGLHHGHYLARCRTANSLPGLCLLDATSNPLPQVRTRKESPGARLSQSWEPEEYSLHKEIPGSLLPASDRILSILKSFPTQGSTYFSFLR